MRTIDRRLFNAASLLALMLLIVHCGDDKGSNSPGSARSDMDVYVIDITVSPPETLHSERLSVSTASNFIDFRDKAQVVNVSSRTVSRVQWEISEYVEGLFVVTRPASAVGGIYDIDRIPTSYSGTPGWEVSSFALFRLGGDGIADIDTVHLTLTLDNQTVFTDREFILESISLSRAVESTIPFMKAGQQGTVRFATTDFCANASSDYRDSRNLHSMIYARGSLECGISFLGLSQDAEVKAFFTSLPID